MIMDKMSLCLGDVLMKYSVFVCEDPKIKLDLYHLVKLAITIQEDIIHEKISFDVYRSKQVIRSYRARSC